VAVVTNIGSGDHLGLNYITTVEDLAVLKRVIVQNVAPDGTRCSTPPTPSSRPWRSTAPGGHLLRRRPHHPVMATHRARASASSTSTATPSSAPKGAWRGAAHPARRRAADARRHHRLPGRERHGRRRRRLGAGPRLGRHPRRPGIGFASDADTAPGRFNVFDYRGATVIADYGHNPDAMRALVQAVEAMPAKRRSVVISGAGDRRDEDIREQTEILGDAFDDVILYQDASASAAAPTARCWPAARGPGRAPSAHPRSTRSAANSSPSTPRWRACSRATCA
jgi:cyanophycin synthetase